MDLLRGVLIMGVQDIKIDNWLTRTTLFLLQHFGEDQNCVDRDILELTRVLPALQTFVTLRVWDW